MVFIGKKMVAIGLKATKNEEIGAMRFELMTFCTPSKRATSLRYAPMEESGRWDLNPRLFGPEPNALPVCATPRSKEVLRYRIYANSQSYLLQELHLMN